VKSINAQVKASLGHCQTGNRPGRERQRRYQGGEEDEASFVFGLRQNAGGQRVECEAHHRADRDKRRPAETIKAGPSDNENADKADQNGCPAAWPHFFPKQGDSQRCNHDRSGEHDRGGFGQLEILQRQKVENGGAEQEKPTAYLQ
jgi:hypothetical protein